MWIPREYFWCENCRVNVYDPECWLCEGPARSVGFRVPWFQRMLQVQRVAGVDAWRLTARELWALESQLIPCPLCDGLGIIQTPDRRTWAECPHCWGALYRVEKWGEPFDPREMPFGYDVAATIFHGLHRNRLKGGSG